MIKAHTARGRLRDRHQQLLRSKLAQLKAEQFGKTGDFTEGAVAGPASAGERSMEEEGDEPVPGSSNSRREVGLGKR